MRGLMSWHLGTPILVMMTLAVLAGSLTYFTRNPHPRGDLEMWCFAENHYRNFTGQGSLQATTQPSPQRRFEQESGSRLSIKLVQGRALLSRLSTLFLSQSRGSEVPDLVELEISTTARFFRPPAEQMGLLPLDELIDKHGWKGKIVENRLAAYRKDGVQFGIPHDVHPVVIAYNDARFRAAGIDLAQSETWDQFQENCLLYQQYWDRVEPGKEHWGLELDDSGSGHLVQLLLQRGINVVDDKGRIALEDPRLLDTIVRYVQMSVGPRRIGVATAPNDMAYTQDLAGGAVGAMIAADWRLKYIRQNAEQLRGKMKVMKLPAWPDSPYRTSTHGGTMIAITRACKNPDLAWKVIEEFYLKPDANIETMRLSYIVPASKQVWDNPVTQQTDAYYSGQQVEKLLVEMADAVPPRYVTPASSAAEIALNAVLIDAVYFARQNGTDGLADHCRDRLHDAVREVTLTLEHGGFNSSATQPAGARP